mgnify:CR=1 FL=1
MNTQTLKKSNQEVKVLAINTLYEWAEKFFNYEKEHFTQFLGVDIFKVDGTIKKKYEHEKISFRGKLSDGTNVDAHYWFSHSYGTFTIRVKICVNGGSYDVRPTTAFCQYEEISLTLFTTNNGVLLPTEPDTAFLKTRFDVAELSAIAGNIKKAAEAYETAVNAMPYRFREVFYIERLTR